jgi:hypothetical protein
LFSSGDIDAPPPTSVGWLARSHAWRASQLGPTGMDVDDT